MRNIAKFKTLILSAALSSLMLSGCSTLSGLNPFSGDSNELQGDIPDQSERLTILSLADTLEVDASLEPVAVTLPAPYTNTSWAQAGGNPYHVMQHTLASGNLSPVWARSIGKGSSAKGRVVASPVVANGTVFAIDADNKVSAINASTGQPIWDSRIEVAAIGKSRKGEGKLIDRVSRPFSLFGGDSGGDDTEAIGGGLAVDNEALYVASGFGLMIKMDIATGEEIWRVPTRTPLHSAPALAGGRVYAISDDNEIFAFDAQSGEVLWTYQGIVESARMLTSPSASVVDDVVLTPFGSGELIALRAQNGGVLWQDALSSTGRVTPLSSLNDIASGPVVADGVVFATAQSGVLSAFDLRTGQRIWSQPAGALGFPWVAGDFIYTVTTGSTVVCMSKSDGRIIWMTQLDNFQNMKKKEDKVAWSGPLMAGERLFLVGSNGQSVLLNPYDGAIIREDKVGGAFFVNPVIANETIYLLSDDAKLIALR